MTHCDCIGPPWPEMIRLQVGGLSQWHVCPMCKAVKEQVFKGPVIVDTIWYEEWDDLSKFVRKQAQDALETHREPEQLPLFSRENNR